MDIFGPRRQRCQSPRQSRGVSDHSPTQQPLTGRMARVIDRPASSGKDVRSIKSELRQSASRAALRPSVVRLGSSCSLQPGASLKRAIDIIIAGSLLVLLSPIILMVAALVRITMGPGVMFSQPRVGLNGGLFDCLKFRTMVLCPEEALAQYLSNNPAARLEWNTTLKLKDDPRITCIGRFLRKSSLDELPQLFNVLCGDMSCVGPRPVVQGALPRYGRSSRWD